MSLPPAFSDTAGQPRLHYGQGAIERLCRDIERAGHERVVIVTSRRIAETPELGLDLLGPIRSRIAGVFGGVEAHSPEAGVLAAVASLDGHRADAVLAIGGGSAVVTARAAGLLLGEGKPLAALATRFPAGASPVAARLLAPKLPQFVILTTPSTAAVKTGAAVLETASGRRRSMADPAIRPVAVALDLRLAALVPPDLARDAALNSFAMAIQGLESARLTPMAEAALNHALELLIPALPRLGSEADGLDCRGALLVAATLIGRATDATGLGLASVAGHCLGALYGLPNGAVNAALLPLAIRYNAQARPERLARLQELLGRAGYLGADPAESCARFLKALGAPASLGALGLTKTDIEAALPAFFEDVFLYGAPRPLTDPALLKGVLLQALTANI